MNIIYSECCGKFITKEQVIKSKNILQSGKLIEVGKYFCSSCKQETTKNGNVKK